MSSKVSSNGTSAVHNNGNGQGTVLVLDSKTNLAPQQYLMSLMQVRTLSKCIELLVEYNIANQISTIDAIEIETLASRLNYDEGNLRRILSFIASHGILKEIDDGKKILGTSLSDLLRDDTPDNIAEMVRHFSRREMQLALIDMGLCLKTGGPSFSSSNGTGYYEYLNKQPEAEKTFDRAVANFNAPMQSKLVYSLYDFSRFSTIAEIAGGRGGLIEKILRQNPDVTGTLFERSAVLPNILPELRAPGLKERFRTVGGNALESIDVEADLFIITNTLTNFNDDDAMKILANIAKAMARSQNDGANSRLLLVETDMSGEETPNEPSILKRGMDMWMLYLMGGRSRTLGSWEDMLVKNDLKITKNFRIPPFYVAFECILA